MICVVPHLVTMLLLSRCLAAVPASAADGPWDNGGPQPVEKLAVASDAELKLQFDAAATKVANWDPEAAASRDHVLVEIARRGGDTWAGFLADELHRHEPQFPVPIRDKPRGAALEVLTTLRRLQRRPDPVHIKLGIDTSKPLRCEFGKLPQIPVALLNQDAGRVAVRFKKGGDNWTGRQARWRFEVRNAEGDLMPVRDYLSVMGGGAFNFGCLGPGDSWSTELEMRLFMPALRPGRYTVRVLYHDSLCISQMADADEVAALVTCRSEQFSLVIIPAPRSD